MSTGSEGTAVVVNDATDIEASDPDDAVATRSALAALLRAGVRAFDPGGVHLVESLLRRGNELDASARARLHARAGARASELAASFAAARRRAEIALADVPQDAPGRATLAAALDAGELAHVVRAARRLAGQPRRWRADATTTAHRAHHAFLRYESARDSLAASIEIARALDAVSELAGPYNASSLAARALGELAELCPAYVRAQIDRLEDLGALLALPAEPARRSRRPRK